LQIVHHEITKQDYWYLQTSDLVIYAAISRYHFLTIQMLVIFSTSCVYLTSSDASSPKVQ